MKIIQTAVLFVIWFSVTAVFWHNIIDIWSHK